MTVRAHAPAPRSRVAILVALCLAAFIISVDVTIVNVALPTLVARLGASTTQLQWIVDAYSLVFAALVLAAGSLSDRLGRKGILLDRFDRFRRGEPGRCILRDHRRTHCFPRLHGPGSSSHVSLDAVLARQCLHRTRRTRHGDRAVGCHDRGRHSDRPNSRWVASGALLVGEHLRLYGHCRRRDSGPRRGFGAEFSGSEYAADRLAGSYVVSGGNDGSDFRRHRSAGLGMDISLRLGLSSPAAWRSSPSSSW